MPTHPPDLRHRPPAASSESTSLLDTLLHDPDPSSHTPSSELLHKLEDFQSRIHYDPDDKPLEDEVEGKGEDRPRDPKALLLRFEELPAWRQDNEFVRSGYRRCAPSFFLFFSVVCRRGEQGEVLMDDVCRTQYSFLGCAKSVFGCACSRSRSLDE